MTSPQESINIPEALVRIIPSGQLHEYLDDMKRTKRKLIGFFLNGTAVWMPRKDAVKLIRKEISDRGLTPPK